MMTMRRAALLGLAAVLAGCGSSTESAEPPPTPPLVQAWRAAQAGDHEGAIVAYRLATESQPDRVEGWLGLAREQIRAGRPADAIAAAERAVELAPESADAHELLGLAQRVAQPAEAATELARALELDPARTRDAFPRARALEAAGQLDEARAAYLQSAEAEILRGRARAAAARVRMQEPELSEAALDAVAAELDRAEADADEDPALAGALAGLRRELARLRAGAPGDDASLPAATAIEARRTRTINAADLGLGDLMGLNPFGARDLDPTPAETRRLVGRPMEIDLDDTQHRGTGRGMGGTGESIETALE